MGWEPRLISWGSFLLGDGGVGGRVGGSETGIPSVGLG